MFLVDPESAEASIRIVAQRPWPKALIFPPPVTRMLLATKQIPQQVG